MVKWIVENHEKTSVRLDGTGIRTRDLPNASLVRYHGATSLGVFSLVSAFSQKNKTYKMGLGVCVCVSVCVFVCVSVCVCVCTILVPPTNFQTSYPIDTTTYSIVPKISNAINPVS